MTKLLDIFETLLLCAALVLAAVALNNRCRCEEELSKCKCNQVHIRIHHAK